MVNSSAIMRSLLLPFLERSSPLQILKYASTSLPSPPTPPVHHHRHLVISDQPREFHGTIRQVRSGPMKMNLVAKLIRGMSIADALAQIKFCEKKAARFIEMVILDTQRKAVTEHDADPLKLWVAESYVGKGTYTRRISYHGKGMSGISHAHYSHYFLTLREGKPPKHKKKIEDSWKYRTRKFIQAGPKSIPNSL